MRYCLSDTLCETKKLKKKRKQTKLLKIAQNKLFDLVQPNNVQLNTKMCRPISAHRPSANKDRSPSCTHSQLPGRIHAFVAYRLILLILFLVRAAPVAHSVCCMGIKTNTLAVPSAYESIVRRLWKFTTTSLVTSARRTLTCRKSLFNVKMRKTIEIVATLS